MANKTNAKTSVQHQVESFWGRVVRPKAIKKVIEDDGRFRVAVGYDKDNKRVKPRFNCIKEAQNFMELWNNYLARNDTFGAAMLTETSMLDYRTALDKLKQLPSVTLQQCVDFYIKHNVSTKGVGMTVKQAFYEYFEIQKTKGLSARSSDSNNKNSKNYVVPIREKFGEELLVNLTSESVEKWLRTRSKKGKWSPRTWNNHRNCGATFWNTLAKKNFCSPALNPWLEIEKKVVKQKSSQSAKVVEYDQSKLFFKFLEEDCTNYPSKIPELAFSVLTWFCGIRVEEATRVNWSSIDKNAESIGKNEQKDFSGWTVTVFADDEKSNVTKINPIPDNAKKWLEFCETKWPEDKLTWIAHRSWEERKKKLWNKFKTKYDGARPLPQNAGRHTWASHHYALYGDKALTSFRLGHTEDSSTLFAYYRAVVKSAAAKKYFQILPTNSLAVT